MSVCQHCGHGPMLYHTTDDERVFSLGVVDVVKAVERFQGKADALVALEKVFKNTPPLVIYAPDTKKITVANTSVEGGGSLIVLGAAEADVLVVQGCSIQGGGGLVVGACKQGLVMGNVVQS
jgi:hypothetical protein